METKCSRCGDEHTPQLTPAVSGPLNIARDRVNDYKDSAGWVVTVFDDDSESGDCIACEARASTRERALARAALFAAAPELLAALKRWAKWCEQNSLPDVQGIACDTFAAIAKAQGEVTR